MPVVMLMKGKVPKPAFQPWVSWKGRASVVLWDGLVELQFLDSESGERVLCLRW